MTPTQLWDEFEAAYDRCSSYHVFDDDAHEVGQTAPYGKLKKKYETVIGYWLNKETIGGHVLHDLGYIDLVDPHVLSMIQEYKRRLKKAKKDIVKDVFG